MSEPPVPCLLPPPIPPKTKLLRRQIIEENLPLYINGDHHQETNNNNNNNNRDGILISTSLTSLQCSRSSNLIPAISTVNLNTVDLKNNVPSSSEDFQELTYSCKNISNSASSGVGHVVKILINPEEEETRLIQAGNAEIHKKHFPECKNSDEHNNSVISERSPSGETCIRISVNNNNNNDTMMDSVNCSRSSPHYYFNQFSGIISSGQISPSDTLDSGTCSDLDGTTPPPPSSSSSALLSKKTGKGVSVTIIGSHKKTGSMSSSAEIDDSDDNESHSSTSSISCDSLNCGKVSPIANGKSIINSRNKNVNLPSTLLKDIRQRKESSSSSPILVDEKSYEDRHNNNKEIEKVAENFDAFLHSDMFFNFHLNEKNLKNDDDNNSLGVKSVIEDETFAGYKDILGGEKSTIKSSKGTVRGVKNRVRAGIATFLQINSAEKTYMEKDAGKVVVYTTTMGIIRETFQACMKVKQILRTLLIKFEERDCFMSTDYQNEIRERMKCDQILIPQLFVNGQHCGDAEIVERLNECGELRKILKSYKNPDACNTCQFCGGYRLLPCGICNGSKKSVHRNHFTTEFVALKCMNCDENGLVKCSNC